MSVRNVIYFHETGRPSFGAVVCKAEAAYLGDFLANFLADVRVTRGTRIAPPPQEDGVTRVNGMGRLAALVVVHLAKEEPAVTSLALVNQPTSGDDDAMDYRFRVSPEREPTGPDPDGEARLMLNVEHIGNGAVWAGLAEDYP